MQTMKQINVGSWDRTNLLPNGYRELLHWR